MRVRTLLVATLALLGLTWAATPAGLPDYDELKAEAEALYADGSYALAQRLYEEADALELDAFESRWVDFRLADTRWRSAAASGNPDSTELDRAEAALEELATAVGRAEERDRVWAEVQESLADFHWDRQRGSDRGTAWEHYRAALESRPRFMDIRSKFAETLIELGELEQAREELTLILESRPSFVGARIRLGVVLNRLGDDEERW